MPTVASSGSGSTPERFQALAQHLAALPERGGGHALQQASIAGQPRQRRGTNSTTDDVTFGGGTKLDG